MPLELDATLRPEPASSGSGGADPAPLDRTATAAGSVRARAAMAEGAVGPGTRLAHFRIERLLGQGGMGQVWLATDLALDRPVALKLLPAETAGDRDRRERLVREARAQARLVHPNVCHIYFIGEDEGRMFFAMEYVDGETLAQRLERGPLPADEAVELARMAALGLSAADEVGFTHRDVKPSNLMIDRHGVLKVMDFGLVASSPVDVRAGEDGAPVAASALVGTPLYMAPEQGRGEAVDRRADIYALGATLHHMIGGAPPFAGDSAAQLLSRHETAVRPKLTATATGATKRSATLADDVIAKMMAKRPADRFRTYDELLAALDRASTARTRPAGMAVRGIAAFLDLLAALVIAAPLIVLMPGLEENVWVLAVWAVLYPIAIARWGATPGRALLDLEVISERGDGRVTFFQAALRFLAEYGPIVGASAIGDLGALAGNAWVRDGANVPVAIGVAYVAISVLHAATRSIDKRTPWDLASGTRTCYRRKRVAPREARA
ncbi:MAG: protein kinase [Deltaproteobacteria bacterium]|nr:protein kinase [Kofleriaceae bacterium]